MTIDHDYDLKTIQMVIVIVIGYSKAAFPNGQIFYF